MIRISDYPLFVRNISSLKDTSIDKRDNLTMSYMTESTLPTVNFDNVKTEYVKDLGLSEVPKSNDALFDAGNEKIVFVEFKNGKIGKREQFGIRKKIYDSVLIFTDIVSIGICSMREFVEYILVYNESENIDNPDIQEKSRYVQSSASFDSFAKTISKLANEEYIFFGVKIFENYCFQKVHTYTEKEFEKYIEELLDYQY